MRPTKRVAWMDENFRVPLKLKSILLFGVLSGTVKNVGN